MLLFPWHFPGKNAGVGCHFLLQSSLDPYKLGWQTFSVKGKTLSTLGLGGSMVSLTAFQLRPCRAAKWKSSPPQYVNSHDRVQTWPHAGPDLRAMVRQPLVSDIHVMNIAPFFYYGFISSVQSALRIRWPKYWSFSFSISPSSEHPGLISFRMDWLDLLAVQGTLKRLLQHHSSKASILHRSAFFMVQLSHTWPLEKP